MMLNKKEFLKEFLKEDAVCYCKTQEEKEKFFNICREANLKIPTNIKDDYLGYIPEFNNVGWGSYSFFDGKVAIYKLDGESFTLVSDNRIKLGLIKGRHPLPVENYILEQSEITDFTKDKLEPIIKKGIEKYVPLGELVTYAYEIMSPYVVWRINNKPVDKFPNVKLYITGLTIVSLIAVEILTNGGYDVEIMGFNPETQKYYSQGTFKAKTIMID